MSVLLRPARRGEASALTGLALRAKAHWGYDRAFLDACRDDLRLRPEDLAGRRVTVAERDGRIVGFATLEGEPPAGELGMLFVEPAEIGRGVGRLLYRQVLRTAAQLGIARLTIGSDPHAEGFYLRMGAERVAPAEAAAGPEALVELRAWPRPEPSWVGAWTGDRPTVNVGNVREFNGTFTAVGPGRDPYACLAAYGSPRPAHVILPEPVDEHWLRDVAAELDWGDVAVTSGIAEDGRVSEAILARPELLARIRASPSRVLPWGRTAGFERILPAPPGVLDVVRRYESKAGAHRLFRSLAAGHPDVTVPDQRPVGTRRALVRHLTRGANATTGPFVLKREYGVGGSGTRILSGRSAGFRTVLRGWPRGGVLLEEYVPGGGPYRNPTFDAVVDADGAVHPVGAGAMDVDGVSYQGVTVGPGALPDAIAGPAAEFGSAVGRRLAEEGYRGWFDVDFVTDHAGRLAPTEINLRLTGPAAAFTVRARLDRLRGGQHVVRALDRLPLGARLPGAAWREHLARLVRDCRELGATLLVTIPTAVFEPAPYVGVLVAARTLATLDAAEAAVRRGNRELGEMFRDFTGPARDSWPPGRRRAARRRS
ncbi:MAG: GNAT family N-acetyltransferase [Actinocatenispora sp.]